MSLHPDYITDADRLRLCSHWMTRVQNLTSEGVPAAIAPQKAAEEMRFSEALLRGWTLRLMSQALAQGQVSARLNAMKGGLLKSPRSPFSQPCAD